MQKRATKRSISSASFVVMAIKEATVQLIKKKCSKKGHFAKRCFKKDTHEIEQNSSEEPDVCDDSDSSNSTPSQE